MGIIIRIDVDRPYGKRPLFRHCLSRLSSDLYLPKIASLGYLAELRTILTWLNDANARAYVFFRRCTLPSESIIELLDLGGHEIGLHLENSRTYETFIEEKEVLERHVRRPVLALSKHGSGGARFGLKHHPPYEPEKYIEWAQQASMGLFFGNLECPSLQPATHGPELLTFPSAFWLEPHWRDTERFSINWLLDSVRDRDIVLLLHPENVLADSALTADFKRIIVSSESRIF
jgi:hypothetical protein